MTETPDSVVPDELERDADDATTDAVADEAAESGTIDDAATVDEDRTGSTMVPPDSEDDPARSPRTLGIDNTDTALGPEDSSAPVE